MSLKFIHAADLHIDSPMKGLAASNEQVASLVRGATRKAFEHIVDLAIEEEVAFIVIAGDVFDGVWDSVATGLWTIGVLRRLEERHILVFVVFGNHDAKNPILTNLEFPSNFYKFPSDKPFRYVYPDDFSGIARTTTERVAITGQSYATEKCTRDLAANYPPALEDAYNIGVLHTALETEKDSTYAPTDIPTLNSKGYNYWALGHVHQKYTAQEEPCWIGFSGVIQSRHINEPGEKGVYLVEIENGKNVQAPQFVPVDEFRWSNVTLDLKNVDTEDELKNRFREEALTVVDRAYPRFVAVRVKLTGRTNLYAELTKANNEQTLVDRLYASVGDISDRLWLQQVELDVKAPVSEDSKNSGVWAELGRYVRLNDVDVLHDLVKYLAPYRSALCGDEQDRVNGVGLDFDDPERFAQWNDAALEILLDKLTD